MRRGIGIRPFRRLRQESTCHAAPRVECSATRQRAGEGLFVTTGQSRIPGHLEITRTGRLQRMRHDEPFIQRTALALVWIEIEEAVERFDEIRDHH